MTTEVAAAGPPWADEQLERDREIAIQRFIENRLREGTRRYVEVFRQLQRDVEVLLKESSDLRSVRGDLFRRHPNLLHPARYIAAPPISADDLTTVVRARATIGASEVLFEDEAAHVLSELVDPIRFPWLRENRAPTAVERNAAIRWTTGLWCAQKVQTRRRMESSVQQQRAVEQTLRNAGLELKPVRRIRLLEDLPRNAFSRECLLAGVKCDLPVRLADGRLLAIECKVSNSSVNSHKRLIHEVGNKAETWERAFGKQVLPAAVLAGVYDLAVLQRAQERNVLLFWEHDLGPLARQIAAVG